MTDDIRRIDLNSDLGEGFGIWRLGDDEALLDVVSSANVACGFHAGDARTMRTVCDLAVARGVAIGAHVGYRDLAGFGRRRIDVDPDQLTDEITYQIGALDAFARTAGDRVRYVKPHGALYHAIASDAEQAAAVISAISQYGRVLPILGSFGPAFNAACDTAGVTTVAEAFADRAYTDDGRLLSRRLPGAVVEDVDAVVDRSRRIATAGTVESVSGVEVDVHARSLCVHGDTPAAVAMATRIREALEADGIHIAAFAS